MSEISLQKFESISKSIKNIRHVAITDFDSESNLFSALKLNASIHNLQSNTDGIFVPNADERNRVIRCFQTGTCILNFLDEKNQNYLVYTTNVSSKYLSDNLDPLRINDGIIICVDCIEGLTQQTERILRQAICDRIIPILFLKNLKNAIKHYSTSLNTLYEIIKKNINKFNEFIEKCNDESKKWFPKSVHDILNVNPIMDTVIFGFKKNLAFRLSELNSNEKFSKLWGENYYNPLENNWSDKNENDYEHSFVYFVLKEIEKYLKDDRSLEKFGITSVDKVLLQIITKYFPSPIVAQEYRTEIFYQHSNSMVANMIMTCDQRDTSVIIYISKFMRTDDQENPHYAFGRILSGTVSLDKIENLNIINQQNTTETNNMKCSGLNILTGDYVIGVDQLTCGNCCTLIGFGNSSINSTTISSVSEVKSLNTMKYSRVPIVFGIIKQMNFTTDQFLSKLNDLERQDRFFSYETIKTNDDTQYIFYGCDEEHLHKCYDWLMEKGCNLDELEVITRYRETITKSESVNEQILDSNEQVILDMTMSAVSNNHYVDVNAESNNGYSITPIACQRKIKPFIDSFLKKGVLIGERIDGIFLKIEFGKSVKINKEIGATVTDVASSLFRNANPRLMEPVVLLEIQCLKTEIKDVRGVLQERNLLNLVIRDIPFNEKICIIEIRLPVAKSFRLMEDLCLKMNQLPLYQWTLDKWQLIDEDSLKSVVQRIRILKYPADDQL